MLTYFNKVEIVGKVGDVRVTDLGEQNGKLVRFTVVTWLARKDSKNNSVIENTWFTCTASISPRTAGAADMKKGDNVHVLGRLHSICHTDSDGHLHNSLEVTATDVSIHDVSSVLEPERP